MTSHNNLPDVDGIWRPWKNTGSTTVPPFGLVKLYEDGSEVAGLYHFHGKTPTGEGGYLYLVNGPLEVASSKTGVCTGRWPLFVALESDAAVAAGKMVGIRANESKLRPDRHGFISTGIRQNGRLLVYPDYGLALIELTATLSTGGSAAAKFVNSAGTMTSETLTVYDRLSTFNGASGTRGYVKWNEEGSRYETAQLQC